MSAFRQRTKRSLNSLYTVRVLRPPSDRSGIERLINAGPNMRRKDQMRTIPPASPLIPVSESLTRIPNPFWQACGLRSVDCLTLDAQYESAILPQ